MSKVKASTISCLAMFSACFLLVVDFSCREVSAKRNDKATVEPAELHLKEGAKKMKAGDFEGASDEFQQACYFARNQYCPLGWLNLGLCYKELHEYPKAIEALLKHLSQTTEKAVDAHLDLAECYIDTSQFDKADEQINLARIDAEYNHPRSYYTLGELCEKINKPGEALEAYNTALAERPWHFYDAWMGRARVEIKMKPPRYNDALKDYKEILESVPGSKINWVELYYNMAQCLYKRGDHQGAIDHLLEALKINPDHFDSHVALGHIFDEEKHITSAINQYEAALRTAPKSASTEQLNKRIIFLQGQVSTQERPKEIKPTPYMRQQQAQEQQQQQQAQQPAGDSGF
jgi:tetratricopeptide (TPR) repeat protein